MRTYTIDTPVVSLFKRPTKKAVLKTTESIHLVDLEDIVRCEANGNYTLFHLKENKKITVSKTLKEYESLFNDYNFFFRIHHSHLINLNYMERLDKKDGGLVVMKDGTTIPVSTRKKRNY